MTGPPPPAALPPAEVERRLPVWCAMAELFLDTEWAGAPLAVARAVAAAGYDAAAAEAMLRWEVRPAFWGNLLAMAGEWQGWPAADVRRRVLAVRVGPLTRLVLGHDRWFPRAEWALAAAALAELQAAAGAAASVAAIQPPPSTRSPA